MLSDRDLSPVSMIAALWSYGPAMRTEMSKRSLAWPQIRKSEIRDMAAYLRTRHPSALRELPRGAAGIRTLRASMIGTNSVAEASVVEGTTVKVTKTQ